MKNIIPVTDLQRQAAQVLSGLSENEPVIITQRGRAAAVLISAQRYAEIEEDLRMLDDLELLQMLEAAKSDVQNGDTISHDEVKKRLKYTGKRFKSNGLHGRFSFLKLCRRQSLSTSSSALIYCGNSRKSARNSTVVCPHRKVTGK